MAVGIYKPGQGYWVRVLTAVGAGAIVLATAAWAWGQAVNIQLPPGSYRVELVDAGSASLDAGETLALRNQEAGDLGEIGSAVVRDASGGSERFVIDPPAMSTGTHAADASFVVVDGVPYRIAAMIPEPIFSPLYLQGGIVAAIMLVGMIVVFFFVGVKKNSAEFLIATDGEMRKVNWSTFREVRGSTVVVITACVLISGLLFVVDYVFSAFFRAIGVLQG